MSTATLRSSLTTAVHDAKQRAKNVGHPILATTALTVPQLNLLSIFSKYSPHTETSLWLGEKDRSMLGLGTAFECNALGDQRFASIAATWQSIIDDVVTQKHACPVALGGFRFDQKRPASTQWKGFPDGSLTIPRITVRTKDNSCQILASILVTAESATSELVDELLAFSTELFTPENTTFNDTGNFIACESLETKDQWNSFVHCALESIAQSDIEKIVGARTLHLESESSISVANVLQRLHQNNPNACVFAFGRNDTYFVGATPEILFSAQSGKFKTMALAGSSRRSADEKEDAQLGRELLACNKERLEHDFVVRTILKALEPLCSRLSIDTEPSLHKLPTLQHLVTHFEGAIHKENTLLDVIEQLHPTPAVGGLPQSPALEFLRNHEQFDRGWYASPVGWLDADDNGEFMVALRSGLICGQEATLFAGCGLVVGSDPEKEFNETQLKFSTMLDGLAVECAN